MKCPNSWKKGLLMSPKILSPKMEKCRTKKKIGHSTSTQAWVDIKCPNSWKKGFLISPKILCPKKDKCWTKKSRAFLVHSSMRRQKMPEQLKKNKFFISPKIWKILTPKIEKCLQNTKTSAQKKCWQSWKKLKLPYTKLFSNLCFPHCLHHKVS